MPEVKPLLVGEVTGRGHGEPLDPRAKNGSGAQLARILGITPEQFIQTFDRVNLCESQWKESEAIDTAVRIVSDLLLNKRVTVILLGKKVAKAFGFLSQEDFMIVPLDSEESVLFPSGRGNVNGRSIVFIPHPSGRCRTWNDRDSHYTARKTLQRAGVSLPE